MCTSCVLICIDYWFNVFRLNTKEEKINIYFLFLRILTKERSVCYIILTYIAIAYHTIFQMITDGRYLHGILDMAFKLSSPVYFYLYDYYNKFSFNSQFGNLTKNLGVTHGDELVSLFKMDVINSNGLSSIDTKVSKRMVKIWSKFALSK